MMLRRQYPLVQYESAKVLSKSDVKVGPTKSVDETLSQRWQNASLQKFIQVADIISEKSNNSDLDSDKILKSQQATPPREREQWADKTGLEMVQMNKKLVKF